MNSARFRFALLDSARGIAALWVLLYHVVQPQIGRPDSPQNPLLEFCSWGQFGVPLFFVISGICVTGAAVETRRRYPEKAVRAFCSARLRRIYPPYLAACVLALLANTLRWGQPALFPADPALAVPWWAAQVLLIQDRVGIVPLLAVAWSLTYELAFYAIVAGVLFVTRRVSEERLLLVLHGVTLLALYWMLMRPNSVPFPLVLWPQFGVGALVYHVLHASEKKPRTIALRLLTATSVLLLVDAWFNRRTIGAPPSTSVQAIFVVVVSWLLLLSFPHDRQISGTGPFRALSGIGRFSYSLYLTHLPVLGLFAVSADSFSAQAPLYGLWCAVSAVTCLSVAVVFASCFECPACEFWRVRLKRQH